MGARTATPTVSILTYCAHPALAYGTLLVFKTLRVGFPTARIEVFDNGSHADVCKQVRGAAAAVGASFEAATPRSHAAHLRWLLEEREVGDGPLVIVDPDVIFWRRVEHWDFGHALMAGRRMPGMGKGAVRGAPRLHPSLLWVQDVERLRTALLYERDRWSWVGEAWDGVGQCIGRAGDQVEFFDTLARAYRSFERRCHVFTDDELDAYDHLFYGSHLPALDARLGPEFDAIADGHRSAAAGELEQLRGMWRRQQAFFEDGVTSPKVDAGSLEEELLKSVQRIQRWQSLQFDDEQLSSAINEMASRVRGEAGRAQ